MKEKGKKMKEFVILNHDDACEAIATAHRHLERGALAVRVKAPGISCTISRRVIDGRG